MKLSNSQKIWAHGLGAAFIGGGSGAFAAGIVSRSWRAAAVTFLVAGGINAFAYLKRSPLPDLTLTVSEKKNTQDSDGNTTQTVTQTTLEQKGGQ